MHALCKKKEKKKKEKVQQMNGAKSKQFLNWETRSEGIQKHDMPYATHLKTNPTVKCLVS